jgi:hypothetical protein
VRSDVTPRLGPFFPVTCHPAVSRRQLLVGGGAWLAATCGGAPDLVLAGSSHDGASIVRRHAIARDDPWIVAHGLRAMGRGFTLADGRPAVDYLLENVLVRTVVNGKEVLGFPVDVEGHPDMFLKTMLEAGVPLDHAFTHEGRRRRLRDVADSARVALRPRFATTTPNALPWSVIALSRTTTPVRRQWVNAWGESVDVDELVETALRLLEQASLPLARAMREGKSETAQAPVHGFACGGTHMLYAVLVAMDAGYRGKDRPARVQQQVDVLVWRLSAEIDFIERFYRARAASAAAAWFALDARLKLLGHAEECLAFAALHKVAKLTPAQKQQRQAAVASLRRILDELETRKLEEAKALDRELYRQLVGDTCHARHGLTLV